MINEEIRMAILETNLLFEDFTMKERLKIQDWKDATVDEIERYRRLQIHKYLENCY